jgi:hypothetical protein
VVELQWLPVSNATGYEVYRASVLSGSYSLAATSTGTSANDTLPLQEDTTYLYMVHATGVASPSNFSGIDPATTTEFTDADPTGQKIKADYILELRKAVNAMRVAAELPMVIFAEDLTVGVTRIKASHVTELRDALDPARSELGVDQVSYIDGTITVGETRFKAAHITDLRNGTQ